MTKVGYIRVSTKEQNTARQVASLTDAGVSEANIYIDEQTGANTNRRGLQQMLDFIHVDDEVVVDSLDRLGRNYDDIKALIASLNTKGVCLSILDAPFLKFNTGNEILDKAMFDMFISLLSYIADNERSKMLIRQRQGIKQAQLRGAYKGRKTVYCDNSADPQKELIFKHIVQQLKDDVSVTEIARTNGVSRPTVYKIKQQIPLDALR